jgi:hypothetical protein
MPRLTALPPIRVHRCSSVVENEFRPLAAAVKCTLIFAADHSHFLPKCLARKGETVANKRQKLGAQDSTVTMSINASRIIAATCRWTARVLGVVFVGLLITLAIGEGMPNPFTQPLGVQMGFLALGILLAGMLAGWIWELAGGILSLAGWLGFVVVVVSLRHMTGFVVIMALPGLFYLASVYLRWRTRH